MYRNFKAAVICLGADALCWTGLTWWMLNIHFNFLAAIFGAYGIVQFINNGRRTVTMYRFARLAARMQAAVVRDAVVLKRMEQELETDSKD